MLGFDYRKDINNLFEVVFNQAAAKIFAAVDSSFDSLILTIPERNYLFGNRDLLLADSSVFQSINKNCYYRQSLDKFILKLQKISDPEYVSNFLICETATVKKSLRLNPQLPTKDYGSLTEELLCQPENFCALICQKVQSPYDLLELIESEVITKANDEAVLQTIPFALFSGFVLLIKQQTDVRIETLHGFVASLEASTLAQALKSRISKLSSEETDELATLLKEYQLPEIDFA